MIRISLNMKDCVHTEIHGASGHSFTFYTYIYLNSLCINKIHIFSTLHVQYFLPRFHLKPPGRSCGSSRYSCCTNTPPPARTASSSGGCICFQSGGRQCTSRCARSTRTRAACVNCSCAHHGRPLRHILQRVQTNSCGVDRDVLGRGE